MFSFLSGVSPKYIVYSIIIVAIVTAGYFGYKYVSDQQEKYERTIRELTLTKQTYKENIDALERLLEEEKKREKVRTVYVERIKEVEVKSRKEKEEIKQLPDSELNKKFKEIMECFEQSC